MKLLIIEDDEIIAQSLVTFFKNNNYTVDSACDGEVGLRLVNNNIYDLIITDYILPKIKGDDLIKQIRKTKNATPILVMSICQESEDKVSLLNIGADDYLIKPFFFAELNARVRALLRRQEEINTQILVFADLTLDLKSHEARRSGKKIYLTTKEFLLLQMFMESPGFTYSKEIITEKVWDDASNHLSNIIEAHILHLRHKIDFKKPFLIQTVPGRGYKLNINH